MQTEKERQLRHNFGCYAVIRKKRGLPPITFAEYSAWKQQHPGRRYGEKLRKSPAPAPPPAAAVAVEPSARVLIRSALAELGRRPWSYAVYARERLAADPSRRVAAAAAAWRGIIEAEEKNLSR